MRMSLEKGGKHLKATEPHKKGMALSISKFFEEFNHPLSEFEVEEVWSYMVILVMLDKFH